jgi:hypothetical protein
MKTKSSRRCASRTLSGKPCAAKPLTDKRFCFFHPSGSKDALRRAQQRGGRANKHDASKEFSKINPVTIADLRSVAVRLIRNIAQGRISVRRAHEIRENLRFLANLAKLDQEARISAIERAERRAPEEPSLNALIEELENELPDDPDRSGGI